jgi:hypothetical protein
MTKYKPITVWRKGRKVYDAKDTATPKEINDVKERIEVKGKKVFTTIFK